jgi:alkylhydroperoxidase/carboxymuconolactone decarboxylase family protein YurZ
MSERQAHAEATYELLFGPRDSSAPDNDPELLEILRRFIFGDVFDTGVLDDRIRELITATLLACLQTLPQLKSHTAAALNVGVQPVQIREAVYQLAPFIGFPRTLNAVATINEAFQDRGIELPLPAQGTVSDADRYSKGLAEQAPLYGNEIKNNLAELPEPAPALSGLLPTLTRVPRIRLPPASIRPLRRPNGEDSHPSRLVAHTAAKYSNGATTRHIQHRPNEDGRAPIEPPRR